MGLLPLFLKRGGLHILAGKGVGAGVGHGKIHLRGFGGAEIPVGAGILHLVEGIPEHLVMSLLTVQQEVNGFPYLLVFNLAVQILVHHLGPLF